MRYVLIFFLASFGLFLFSFVSQQSCTNLSQSQDSISRYVDQHCHNDTCRLLDRKARREVFYKKLNDGEVIVIFDFWKNVTVLHKSSGKWSFVDRIEWDFVSAFAEFKQFNKDGYDDLVIYGELDEWGNSRSYVYLYNPAHKHIEHFPSYDLLNFDYDISNNIYKSAHYGGMHHDTYQSIYRLQHDSLILDQHLHRIDDDSVFLVKRNTDTFDTTMVENDDKLWKTFGNTTWYY